MLYSVFLIPLIIVSYSSFNSLLHMKCNLVKGHGTKITYSRMSQFRNESQGYFQYKNRHLSYRHLFKVLYVAAGI